jgi:CO/xanthine dehydrogenase FAD-binding subunit
LVREYVLAATAEEAARLIGEDPAAVVMGGGTTVMPRATAGELAAERVVGLHGAGLEYVRREGGVTRIGAMTRLQAIAELDELPTLAAAARAIGGWALRNSGTIGGNLLVAPPYGDLVPVLLALDAEIRLVGSGGERTVSLAERRDGAVGDGSEILVEIVVPDIRGAATFQRCARRAANTPAVVSVAARVVKDGDAVTEARLALGGVGPQAVRVTVAEELLVRDPEAITAAAEAAVAATDPVDDAVASAWYRRRMTAVYVRRALGEVLA